MFRRNGKYRLFRTKATHCVAVLALMVCCDGALPLDDLNGLAGLLELGATMTPDRGPAAGGTRVTIRGEGFSEDHVLTMGGVVVPYEFINPGLIEFTTPPRAPGGVNVVLSREPADDDDALPDDPSGGNGEEGDFGDWLGDDDAGGSPDDDPDFKSAFDVINVLGQYTYTEEAIGLGRVSPDTASSLGGTAVTITGENFMPNTAVLFGGMLGENTRVVSDKIISTVAPAQAPGKVDIAIVTPGQPSLVKKRSFLYVLPDQLDDGSNPRLVGATSLDNNTILVTFSKPMSIAIDGPNGDITERFEITGSETSFLVVTDVLLLDDMKTVELTTLTQDYDLYTLHVVGLRDIFGNELATPQGLLGPPAGGDPTRTTFRGTAPTQEQIDFDSDGDGFGDWFEMKGWTVTIRFANGTEESFHTTSDPFAPDTDLDGIDDSVENQFSMDPRTNDTDADQIEDWDEFNVWFSDPLNQDTDGDGLADPLEINVFKTSPILEDTDGDQWTDSDEILFRNRNPRRSDIPLPQVKIGEVGIFIRESYSFTDEEGTTQSTERSSTNTLAQSNDRTFATSDTQSSENTDAFSQEFGTEFTFGGQDPFGGFTITADIGFEQTRQRGYSSTVDTESSRSSSEEFQESIGFGNEFSENRSFTRSIEEARLNTDVTISNLGDVAFTISDVELSAFVRDPVQRVDIPLATMLSERSIDGDDQQFNLGPFDSDRGPFIFRDIQIFPNVAEQLRAAPQALTIKLANFNIRDEAGRLFAFSSQDINDRTAGIVIDYGNGEVESHRVATAGRFNEAGRSVGITMATALQEILDFEHVENDDMPIAVGPPTQDVLNSYGTVTSAEELEFLTRVRNVQSDVEFTATPPGEPPAADKEQKTWAIVSSVNIPDGTDFNDIVLKAGESYSLQFVADLDDDGLFARTEYLYGSSDQNNNTDGDGILDFDEVRTGWIVDIPGNPRRAFSDPVRPDSDADGLEDQVERDYQTDPRQADTDEDGISDIDEIEGYNIVLADDDQDSDNNVTIRLLPYINEAIVAGPNGIAETTAAGSDTQENAVGTGSLSPEAPVVISGPDGVMSTTPVGDDILRPFHNRLFASDPLRRDTDGDGLTDGREQVLGSIPNNPADSGSVFDTDEDGLTDNEEINGWMITINGVTSTVTSNPNDPDSDDDGLPDLMEQLYGLNPNLIDSDGDDIDDIDELDVDNDRGFFPAGIDNEFAQRCTEAVNCNYAAPGQVTETDPRKSDTDNDGIDDKTELEASWTVAVTGQGAYTVMSSPFTADADGDNLNDAQERTAGLDPNNQDTDGDAQFAPLATRNDFQELSVLGSDPLTPDMFVNYQFVSILVDGDCDGTPTDPHGIELEGGGLFLLPPGAASPTNMLAPFPCIPERDGTTEAGGSINISASTTFLLRINQSYTVSSGDFIDHDNDGCAGHNEDDVIGRINNAVHGFPESSGNRDYTISSGAGCQIRVRASIDVN